MPAVIIRMVDALATIADETTSSAQRDVLLRQAEAIKRSADESVSEPSDRDDIQDRYRRLISKLRPSDAEAVSS